MAEHTQATTIFLHIPKTAGSTIRTLLSQNYDPKRSHAFSGKPEQADWFIGKDQAFRDNFDLIHGHNPYGIHEHLTRECVYFTFFRDPVRRFFSDYFFAIDYEDHNLHQKIKSGEMTILDYARLPERVPYFDNLMTQYMVGRLFERPSMQDLELAKARIEKDIAVFGITERFDESLLLIARRLGWHRPFYLNKNISPKTIKDVPDDAIAVAEPYLTKDRKLYEFACELFERRVNEAGAEFTSARDGLARIEARLHKGYDREKNRIYAVGKSVGPKLMWANRYTGIAAIDSLWHSRDQQAVHSFIASDR